MSDAIPATPRPRCYVCLRPLSMCWCGDIPQVVTKTDVVILQHFRERTHPFGTARLVSRCLPRSRLEVVRAGYDGDLQRPLSVPADTAVLYPHPAAVDLAALAPHERPSTLLVLDGTWAHAKRLYQANTWLTGLRHVRLNPSTPSRYRIRSEPRADYVSTLEAIVEALQILEPETPGLDQIVGAFVRMIDRQLAHMGGVTLRARQKRTRQRESRRISPILRAPGLVVLHAEAAIEPGEPSGERRLVHLAAARLDDGATFEAVVKPLCQGPPDNLLRHMGLTRAQLLAGRELADVRAAFGAFVAGAPVCAWMTPSLDHVAGLLPEAAPRVALRASYCNLRGDRSPSLEAVLTAEGLSAGPALAAGRAGAKLACAVAVARWLRAQAG